MLSILGGMPEADARVSRSAFDSSLRSSLKPFRLAALAQRPGGAAPLRALSEERSDETKRVPPLGAAGGVGGTT
jgi:hypothetical protein